MQEIKDIKAKGRIRLEKLDKRGEVVEAYEKDNLVVNTASDIIVKALSGDPRDILWKSPAFYSHYTGNRTAHAPLEGKDFYWEYTYNPRCIYRKTNVSSGKSGAYVLGNWPSSITYGSGYQKAAYVEPEQYSTDVVNFVGIGIDNRTFLDGMNEIFKYKGNWSQEYNHREDSKDIIYHGGIAYSTTNPGDSITFNLKATEVTFLIHARTEDQSTDISLDIVDEEGNPISFVIEKVDPENSDNLEIVPIINNTHNNNSKTLQFVIRSLPEKDLTFTLKHAGEKGKFEFEGIITDGLTKSLTSLAYEVPNYADSVPIEKTHGDELGIFEEYAVSNEVPAKYANILPPEANIIELNNRGTDEIIPESVEIYYNEKQFTPAPEYSTPKEGEFLLIKSPSNGKYEGLVWIGENVPHVSVKFKTVGKFKTNYHRAVIEKPKSGINYPYYDYSERKVTYVAKFEEGNPNAPVRIKSLALFSKPLASDINSESTSETITSPASSANFVSAPIVLKEDNIVVDSERIVSSNGIVLVKDEDYKINYKTGVLTFLNNSRVSPSTKYTVNYEYSAIEKHYPDKMFSIVNIEGEGFLKRADETLRVVWEIVFD